MKNKKAISTLTEELSVTNNPTLTDLFRRIDSNLDFLEADLMRKWAFIKDVTRDISKLKYELKKNGVI